MTSTCTTRYLRLLALVMLLPLLTSCAELRKIGHPATGTDSAQAPDTDRDSRNHRDNDADADNASASAAAKIIPARQEITPTSSIEKNHLSVSYSLNTVQGKHEKLLRLTLIFKNLSGTTRHIWPHITLHDAHNKPVGAYSLTTFQRILERATKSARKNDSSQVLLLPSDRVEMFWMKSSYKIPPHGIAIGELIYHGKQFSFPMKLTVRIYKDYYRFNAW